MGRLYARAQGGMRAPGSLPRNWGGNVTLIGSLAVDGTMHAMSVSGSVDGDVFSVYVKRILCPNIKKGDVIVMDNLSTHKISFVRKAIEAKGAKLQFLPPYSPEMNPIEKCWSKIKTALRTAAARSRDALDAAITEALATVTAQDAKGWFESCGYSLSA
jgi:transposase